MVIEGFANVGHYRGGLELIFGNIRKHAIKIPKLEPVTTTTGQQQQNQRTNVRFLINHLCENYVKDGRQDMFVQNGTV
jgi:hypothetical protein